MNGIEVSDMDMNRIYDDLAEKLDLELDDEVQYELARLLSIVQEAQAKQLEKVAHEAQVAMQGLLRPKPKLQFARTVRYRLEMELLRHNGLATRYIVRWSSGNPVAIVGLGVLLTCLIGLVHWSVLPHLPAWFASPLFAAESATLTTVAAAAFLGGVVSLLSRMREFSKLRDFDPIFLFWNGLLKPYVGIIFAIFVFAFLKSEFVPAVKLGSDTIYVWWVVGFLSGFSERFTRDIISKSEGAFSGGRPA